jgi:hypothetical protein
MPNRNHKMLLLSANVLNLIRKGKKSYPESYGKKKNPQNCEEENRNLCLFFCHTSNCECDEHSL